MSLPRLSSTALAKDHWDSWDQQFKKARSTDPITPRDPFHKSSPTHRNANGSTAKNTLYRTRRAATKYATNHSPPVLRSVYPTPPTDDDECTIHPFPA